MGRNAQRRRAARWAATLARQSEREPKSLALSRTVEDARSRGLVIPNRRTRRHPVVESAN